MVGQEVVPVNSRGTVRVKNWIDLIDAFMEILHIYYDFLKTGSVGRGVRPPNEDAVKDSLVEWLGLITRTWALGNKAPGP